MGHPDAPPDEYDNRAQTGMVRQPESQVSQFQPQMPMQQSAGVIAGSSETSVAAAAATAKALIESRYLIAQHRPRNWLNVLNKLIDACRRPSFAQKAEYAIPRWNNALRKNVDITGPTIRFAEECFRNAGNLDVRVDITNETPEHRHLLVSVIDLESNLAYSRPVILSKTREAQTLRPGQVAKATRQNATGALIYIVETTEDDLTTKQNAAISKLIRTDGLRMIPADIVEDALAVARVTRTKEGKEDPAGVAKRLAYGFYKLGVDTDQLEKYLGKRMHVVNADDVQMLTGLHSALSDGDVSWENLMKEREDMRKRETDNGKGEDKGADDNGQDAGGNGAGVASTPAAAAAGVNGARERAAARKAAQDTTRQREPGDE